jgi:hypothetical protein
VTMPWRAWKSRAAARATLGVNWILGRIAGQSMRESGHDQRLLSCAT